MLTAVEFPLWPEGHRHAFVEYARRKGDFAIVGVAVLLDINTQSIITRAAIAIGGCAATPLRLREIERTLTGQPAMPDVCQAAARLAANIDAQGDVNVTADYRKHLARVLTGRALLQAIAP